MVAKALLGAVGVLGLMTATSASFADSAIVEQPDPKTMTWKWRRFSTPEYVTTGALLAGTVSLALLKDHDLSANFRGGALLDDGVRAAWRVPTPAGRERAQQVSDSAYYGSLAYPVFVDVVAVAWIGHGAPDTAGQMALIDAEAYAITGFLSFLSNATIRRERPYLRACGPGKTDPQFPSCTPGGQSESFFSGHTGIAFTGAALTCSHHANLPLYGKSPVGGVIVCSAMMAGAAVTGIGRIMADKHYATDVLTGAAIGLTSGFVIPWLHYRSPRTDASKSAFRITPLPMLSGTGAGMGAIGTF